MYTGYYNLSERPFELHSDPRYLWLGEKHRDILSKLELAVRAGKSFVVFTGEEGTGKTTLIRALLDRLEPGIRAARIPEPDPDTLEFQRSIAEGFNLDRGFTGEEEFLIAFRKFLKQAHRNDKRILLVIDQAEKLTETLLEQIRLLSNIELPGKKLIQIFLAGRNTLYEKLKSPACRGLAQRIELKLKLPPLSKGEVSEYILHRIKAAGGSPEIFKDKALREIEKISSGNLRLVNQLCDQALQKGHAKTLKTISPEIIKECRKEILPRRPFLFLRRIGFFSAGVYGIRKRSNSYRATRRKLRSSRRTTWSGSVRWSLASGTLVLLIALFLPAIGYMPSLDWFRSSVPQIIPMDAEDREGRIFRYAVEDAPKRLDISEPPERKADSDSAYGFAEDHRVAAAPEVSPPAAPADPARLPETKEADDQPADPPPSPMKTYLPLLGSDRIETKTEPDLIETEVVSYFHRVQWRGETLSIIAEWYTGSAYNWKDIAEANPGIDPHRIHIGQDIFIPQYLLKVQSRMPADYLSSASRSSR